MSRNKDKSTVDFDDISITSPTVDISIDSPPPLDSIVISITPEEYRTKKFRLVEKSLKLKDSTVAYKRLILDERKRYDYELKTYTYKDIENGERIYKVKGCVDFFPYSAKEAEKLVAKTLATCLASENSCVVITDEDENLYVCTLNENFYYGDICTFDDNSSKYGGLTYLETRGNRRIPDTDDKDNFFKINFIVTADGYPLVPVKDKEDFIENNEYYYVNRGSSGSGDLVTKLIYVVKSGELEKYVTGVFYRGEN